jgi:predicted nucleotidyltransferase
LATPAPASADPDRAGAATTGAAERERVLRVLRRHEGELRARGVRRLRLFGSVARGEADLASDVDLIAEIDHGGGRGFSLFDLVRLEDELAGLVGRPVEVVTAPDKLRPRVRARVERDAVEAF